LYCIVFEFRDVILVEMLSDCALLDLSNMYDLLSPIQDSLDVFAAEFEEHVTNTGLAVMQSLQGENVRLCHSL